MENDQDIKSKEEQDQQVHEEKDKQENKQDNIQKSIDIDQKVGIQYEVNTQQLDSEIIRRSSQIQVQKGLSEAQKDRKQISYNFLNEYYKNFQIYTQIYEITCNQLFQNVDQSITVSSSGMLYFTQFFKSQLQLEQNYQENLKKLPQIGDIFVAKYKNAPHYNFTQNLIYFDKMQQQFLTKQNDFCVFLEKDILQNIIAKETNEFKNKLEKFTLQMKLKFKQLQKNKKDLIIKQNIYNKQYTTMMSGIDSRQKDLYVELNDYILSIDNIQLTLIDISESIKIFYEYFVDLEIKRTNTIYILTQKYLKKYHEFKGDQNLNCDLIQKIADKPVNSIDKNLINLLQENDQQKINAFMGKKQENLDLFLNNFGSYQNVYDPLITKQFEAKMKIGSYFKSFIDTQIVFTIDHYIHFLLVKDGKNKILQSLKQQFIDAYLTKDKNLELIEKRKGVIFNSNLKLIVKFYDDDIRDEFYQNLQLIKDF